MKLILLSISILLQLSFLVAQNDNSIRIYAELDNFANDTINIDQLNDKCVTLKYESFSSKKTTNNNNSIVIKNLDNFNFDNYSIETIEVISLRCLDGIKNITSNSNCLNLQQSKLITPKNKIFIDVFVKRINSKNLAKLSFFLVLN